MQLVFQNNSCFCWRSFLGYILVVSRLFFQIVSISELFIFLFVVLCCLKAAIMISEDSLTFLIGHAGS